MEPSDWKYIWQNDWVRNLFLPLAVFLLFFFLSAPVANGLFRLLRKADEKTGRRWFGRLEYSFRRPLHVLLAGIGIYTALSVCPAVYAAAGLWPVVEKCFRSFLVLILAWGLYRMADSAELTGFLFARKLDLQVDKALLPALSSIIRFVILALAALIIAQEWNYSISGLLAGLGLGGLAFALAAKDMLANLFGGLVILLDRPFSIGDWIQTGNVEGTVEDINFRSVKVRASSQALVTVPNSMVASAPVFNFSRMGKRKSEFTVSLKYGTTAERIRSCTEKIRQMLLQDEDIEDNTLVVALDSLGEKGPGLLVSCFFKTADWKEFMHAREKVFFSVLDILKEENVEIAVPVSTLEIKNKINN